MPQQMPQRVAVTSWSPDDGIAQVICDELFSLGYDPFPVNPLKDTPSEAAFVFSYGPYGYFLPLPQRLATMGGKRPIFIHWNTEGIPDPRLPWNILRHASQARSWLGRHQEGLSTSLPFLRHGPLRKLKNKMTRFRYVGDYYYAYKKGWLHVFADSSEVYANIHRSHQLPTIAMPWGATKRWYSDLGLERDLDVLWLGKRGGRRRSDILDNTVAKLRDHGVSVHLADGEENRFIFDDERTQFLNRAKITLNITRTWYDDNFSRFAMAIPNRSLIVSEKMMPHCTAYTPNEHYISTEFDKLADAVLYYLEHEDERNEIVGRAYAHSTTKVTFEKTVKTIMNEAERQLAVRDGVETYAFGDA